MEWRDNLAWKVCNFVLGKVATESYGGYLHLAIKYGILRLAQDEGNAEGFRKYWIPDEDTRYRMLAGFLTEEEGMVLTTADGSVVYLSPREVKVTKMFKKGDEDSV